MTTEELKNIKADKVVDARGTSCPGPILAAKKGLVDVKAGQIMEVWSTDIGTKRDIPAWAKKMGLEYLGEIEDGGSFKLFVKKVQ